MLEQVLRPTPQRGLYLLPAGAADPAALLQVEPLRVLLRRLAQQFDLLLLDGPRWDGRTDVLVLGAVADAVYLVVPEKEADADHVRPLYDAIPEQGARLAGSILVA